MTTGQEFWKGYSPKVEIVAGNPEAQKYGEMWKHPEYRLVSPGEMAAPRFLSLIASRLRASSTITDFGCGTGRAAKHFLNAGLRVTLVDFVNNCLDEDVAAMLSSHADRLRFIKADLEKPIPAGASEFGYCCDVMEHIPEHKVQVVLQNILAAAQHVFFSISTQDDQCGKLLGEDVKLHLTVQPAEWWQEQFAKIDAKIEWAQDVPGTVMFLVSAWQDGQVIVDHGIVNTVDEQVRANVRHNVAQGWEQVRPHKETDLDVMILGGGPSMAQHEDEIKALRADGVKLITLNGAYNWCLERGLVPSAQIMVDARAFNARFVKPVVDECKYLIASQCDPSVFEGLPRDRTFIWHTTAEQIEDILKEHYPLYWPVPGGSTVLLRAIPLLRMLGYKRFHLFGCDSCLSGSEHHAYAQAENDNVPDFPVIVGGRTFRCHSWMAAQAQEMLSLIRFMGDQIELQIHGDGLLSWILEHAASLEETDAVNLVIQEG
jgi:SAM-dependent methyltransferase